MEKAMKEVYELLINMKKDQAKEFKRLNDIMDRNHAEVMEVIRTAREAFTLATARNLIFLGIPNTVLPSDLEKKLIQWLKEASLAVTEADVISAHRLFRPRQQRNVNSPPIPVIVAWSSEKTRDLIYKSLKKQKGLTWEGNNIYVMEDLSSETQPLRRIYNPLRRSGKVGASCRG